MPQVCPRRRARDGSGSTFVEGHGRRGRTRYGPCSDGLQLDRRVRPVLGETCLVGNPPKEGRRLSTCTLDEHVFAAILPAVQGSAGSDYPTGVTSAAVRPTG